MLPNEMSLTISHTGFTIKTLGKVRRRMGFVREISVSSGQLPHAHFSKYGAVRTTQSALSHSNFGSSSYVHTGRAIRSHEESRPQTWKREILYVGRHHAGGRNQGSDLYTLRAIIPNAGGIAIPNVLASFIDSVPGAWQNDKESTGTCYIIGGRPTYSLPQFCPLHPKEQV